MGKKGEIVVRILTPTENKRFNELIGFVGLSLAILLALSLLSYSPRDASFNVSAPPPGAGPARNWIGPVGAHLADLFFQFSGFAAFLFPIGMFLVAMRWFRSQLLDAPIAKLIGFTMLLASFSSELALLHAPEVRSALPAGGMMGTILAESLRAAFNPLGANLVSIATLLTALFLTTSFSFRAALAWMKKPMANDGYIGQLLARVQDWREARESDRLRKRVEEIKNRRTPSRPAPARFHQGTPTKTRKKKTAKPRNPSATLAALPRSSNSTKTNPWLRRPPRKNPPNQKSRLARPHTNSPRPRCSPMPSAAKKWTRTS